MIGVILFSVLIVGLYVFNKWHNSYWKRRGISSPDPLPLVGNLLDTLLLRKSLAANLDVYYKQFNNVPYYGVFKFTEPLLVIREPSLIKKIMTTDFYSFQDNAIYIDEEVDEFSSKNPFLIRGEKWKLVRGHVSPAFSSGKTRNVYPLILEVCDEFIQFLSNDKAARSVGLEAKELCGKFTTDVVASCAFGLKANSISNPDAIFRQMGNKVFEKTFANIFKFLIIMVFPKLANILKARFIPLEVSHWFKKVIEDTIKYRKDNNVVREDFLNSMVQLQDKVTEYDFNVDHITGHLLSFLTDGFETSSYVISFALYEIAANPDVQVKLRNEIKEAISHHNGIISYDALIDMKYLECVIFETMRKYPAGAGFFKVCTKDYVLPPLDGGSGAGFTVTKGSTVFLPLHSLHLDPKYFPNPQRFDPERFLDEESKMRAKNAYYPFGEGPRVCLGMRFAMVQAKACIASVVLNMDISVDERTVQPLEIDPKSLLPATKDGCWLTFTARNFEH